MLRACQPVLAELASGDVVAALMNNAEAVLLAAAIGARIQRERLDDMELDEVLNLAAAVIDVNADFFARRVSPAMTAAMERLAGTLAGSTSTPVSAAPDSAA
jgi:hypothetical protein